MDNRKALLTPNPMLPNHVVSINPELCVACNQCAEVCRCSVIVQNPTKDQPPVVIYPDECWHCAVCTEHCPTGAITFEHPINQKIVFKDAETGELYRVGMKNPPPANTKRAYGDESVKLVGHKIINLETLEVEKLTRYFLKAKFGKGDAIPDYAPGHFVNLKIDDESFRGYSIGNKPGDGFIELFIDLFPNGKGGKFFEALEVGKNVEFTMPLGRFVYKPKETPVIMIGSGTGMASIKAMIENELYTIKSGRPVKLLLITWDEEDIMLNDLFDELEAKFDNFSYEIMLSNQDTNANKTGKIVEENLENYIKNNEFITSEIDAYICGSKVLVKSIEKYLFRKDVFWKNISYESFL